MGHLTTHDANENVILELEFFSGFLTRYTLIIQMPKWLWLNENKQEKPITNVINPDKNILATFNLNDGRKEEQEMRIWAICKSTGGYWQSENIMFGAKQHSYQSFQKNFKEPSAKKEKNKRGEHM